MANASTVYKWQRNIRNRIRAARGSERCRRCGKKFRLGDVIMSRGSRYHAKRYHASCFKKMLIE
jgi:hypothetical protein